jgi:hypothetical protein
MTEIDIDVALADRAREELGSAIRIFLRERTAVDSPLFDVTAKMVYGNYASAVGVPLLMDLVNARATPEEIGTRLKVLGVPLGLVMNGIGWAYSIGRLQMYLDAGWPEKDIDATSIEERTRAAELYTWWARIMQVYRNDGELVTGEGGAAPIFTTLPGDVVNDVVRRARARGPVEDTAALRRAVAELDMYEFVTHAEARDGIHHHGPYDLGEGRCLLVKEFTDLQNKFMPSVSDEHRLDVSRVVVALVVRDVDIRMDIFAVHSEPENYYDRIEAFEILAGDDLRPIPLEDLVAIADSSTTAQRKYFMQMARWDDHTKVTHASAQYANDFHALMSLAGYDDDEVRTLYVQPFIANAEAFFDRSVSEDRLKVFGHILGDTEPIFPEVQK